MSFIFIHLCTKPGCESGVILMGEGEGVVFRGVQTTFLTGYAADLAALNAILIVRLRRE
jgi:hypothetical protein